MAKLQAVLDGDDPDRVPEDATVSTLCEQQRQIKWEQLMLGRMLGRFAKDWSSHHGTQPGQDRVRHSNWTTEVIDFIFTQWWKLWELRNQDRHGRDLATQRQATAQQVDRELTMFYDDYEGTVPQHLNWIFDTRLKSDDSGCRPPHNNGLTHGYQSYMMP